MTQHNSNSGKNNPMGSDTTKPDGEALGKVKAFLNLRNKRLDGANPTIASLVNDDHCAVRLTAPDLRDVVCEIDTLRELYAVTCQSNDRQRETIKTQSAEIHALLSRVADQAAEIERLRQLIIDLTISLDQNLDGDACWTDHHGYCQAHQLDDVNFGGCRVENARRLVNKMKNEFIKPDAEQALKGGAA